MSCESSVIRYRNSSINENKTMLRIVWYSSENTVRVSVMITSIFKLHFSNSIKNQSNKLYFVSIETISYLLIRIYTFAKSVTFCTIQNICFLMLLCKRLYSRKVTKHKSRLQIFVLSSPENRVDKCCFFIVEHGTCFKKKSANASCAKSFSWHFRVFLFAKLFSTFKPAWIIVYAKRFKIT